MDWHQFVEALQHRDTVAKIASTGRLPFGQLIRLPAVDDTKAMMNAPAAMFTWQDAVKLNFIYK
ncbi:hypothetical protein T12_5113 [Trichinella patagoniensis]|uniref:Uncharacterized protein n=1 Tax=Trichinella patagoniensis TaxID=990121 RepID=A0A0V1A1S5_9BILA|nr:hypothetical protein T12_14937 [Trichinella patagoniensis]KRY18346.1 hypothetical protein T12_5113 [Trichinella patagoniensis]